MRKKNQLHDHAKSIGESRDKDNQKLDLIIDTKYKILLEAGSAKEGVSQADLYQMFAYSKKYDCKKVILLYPRLMDQPQKDITFIIDNDTHVFVRTVDLCRDFKIKLERDELKKELCKILAA